MRLAPIPGREKAATYSPLREWSPDEMSATRRCDRLKERKTYCNTPMYRLAHSSSIPS